MKLIKTEIEGLFILEPRVLKDTRGQFIKTYTDDFFKEHGLDITIKETYYTISNKDVIRGMHFQTPPHDHTKLVYVASGSILDVVLDIRKNSSTYGKYLSTEISDQNRRVLIIPNGLAHGFKTLEDNTNVSYMQTSTYSPNNDTGIMFDSFGFDWNTKDYLTSDRDNSFEIFSEFDTPFIEEYK